MLKGCHSEKEQAEPRAQRAEARLPQGLVGGSEPLIYWSMQAGESPEGCCGGAAKGKVTLLQVWFLFCARPYAKCTEFREVSDFVPAPRSSHLGGGGGQTQPKQPKAALGVMGVEPSQNWWSGGGNMLNISSPWSNLGSGGTCRLTHIPIYPCTPPSPASKMSPTCPGGVATALTERAHLGDGRSWVTVELCKSSVLRG